MPTTGGVYSLPPSYFAIAGTTIRVEQHNPPLEDIAQALTDRLMRDGTAPMTGNLAMGGNNITGAGSIAGTSATISGAIMSSAATPYFDLKETDGTSGYSTTRITTATDVFHIQTRDSDGVFVANDYRMPKGSSGATSHIFYIGGTEAAVVEAAGTSISDAQAIVTLEKADARYLTLSSGGTLSNSSGGSGDVAGGVLLTLSNLNPGILFHDASGGDDTDDRILTNSGGIMQITDSTGAVIYTFNGGVGATSILSGSAADGRYMRGISNGGQIDITGSLAGYTIAHADTSSIANSSNSDGTVIQSLTWDGNGHAQSRATVNLDNRYLRLIGGTVTSNIRIAADAPFLELDETDQSATDRRTSFGMSGGNISFFDMNSDWTLSGTIATIKRDGSAGAGTDVILRDAGDARYARLDAAVGAVGTYAMCRLVDGTSANAGATKAGSSLKYANAGGTNNTDTSPSGTWRCMGEANQVDSGKATTLWLRIS